MDAEAATAKAGLDKAERDYLFGPLHADGYARLTVRGREALAAVEAERDRVLAHLEEIEAAGEVDAESETLRRVAALRDAIGGLVRDASAGVGPLRAAMTDVFSLVYLVPECLLFSHHADYTRDWRPSFTPG